jgi:hypothetical protein
MADPENDNFFTYVKQFVIELLNPAKFMNDRQSQCLQPLHLNPLVGDEDAYSDESIDDESYISSNADNMSDVDSNEEFTQSLDEYNENYMNKWFYS